MDKTKVPFTLSVGAALTAFCITAIVLLPESAVSDPTAPAIKPVAAVAAEDGQVLFNRDVRPILSNNCFFCHGPDKAQMEKTGGFRLDTRETAVVKTKKSGKTPIVPGKPDESELVKRITSNDAAIAMPPPDSNHSLTEKQKQTLIRWIEQGAEYQKHWSYVTPQRPVLPEAKFPSLANNQIDVFVQRKLAEAGFKPAAEADRRTLIRRVTFDLIGVPPTPAEVEAFVNDKSPDAYEKVVDRLLSSPKYGEHIGRYWLDAVRYGDTHGLHLDNYRQIWPYRDWVINAFNRNLPFDQFTIDQIAGDLVKDPTDDQLIATGFVRSNITTAEGGSIVEEVLVRNVVDRVETVNTVWMATSAGCSVCHDHKYDPLTMEEFYAQFDYFNDTAEPAMDGNQALFGPTMKIITPESRSRVEDVRAQIAALSDKLNAPLPEIDAAQVKWEEQWRQKLADQWAVLKPAEFKSTNGSSLRELEDHSILAEGTNPAKEVYEATYRTTAENIAGVRLEALKHESNPLGGVGRAANSNFVLSEIEAEAVSVRDPSEKQMITFVSAIADYDQGAPFVVASAIDGKIEPDNGWGVHGGVDNNRTAVFVPSVPFGYPGGTEIRVKLRFESRHVSHVIGRFRISVTGDASMAPASLDEWQTTANFPPKAGQDAYDTNFGPEPRADLTAKDADGKPLWTKAPSYPDGKVNEFLVTDVGALYLHRTIHSPSPRQMDLSLGSDDAIRVWLNGSEVHGNNVRRPVAADQDKISVNLVAGKNDLLLKIVNYGGGYGFFFNVLKDHRGGIPFEVADLLTMEPDKRDEAQTLKVRDFYRRNFSQAWREQESELKALQAEEDKILESAPATLIARDMDNMRPSYILERGEYDQRGEQVNARTPAYLPPMDESLPNNRLGYAKWLVSRDHPLTARVTVNRYWQRLFGAGLVKTSEDFGSQGEWPSHPELLDWLAVEFMESGWDVRHMQKLLVMSHTYRQSSRVTPELLEKDPKNRFLARGPRFRLDAEMIRDQAMAVSGLLVEKMGGPSVKPYQPIGLWKAVGYTSSNTANFKKDEGDAQYRRTVYTFWKRTSAPPNLVIFDAPTREICTVRRERTNTPLQQFVLWNDPQFAETYRHLGERMIKEGGATPRERIAFAFELATARKPSAETLSDLTSFFNENLHRYEQDREAAEKYLSIGDSPRDKSLDVAEHAAYTMTATAIMILDETVTKN